MLCPFGSIHFVYNPTTILLREIRCFFLEYRISLHYFFLLIIFAYYVRYTPYIVDTDIVERLAGTESLLFYLV